MQSENDSDEKLFVYNFQKFWNKYINLHRNLNFPPLTLYKNEIAARKYRNALVDAYQAGRLLPEIDFITGDAKPLDEFEAQFGKEIAEAKKFRTAANEDPYRALDLYAEQTGEEIHESEYREIGKYNP